jgi:RNA polymerase sigma-70 factor (ECF subfamily)
MDTKSTTASGAPRRPEGFANTRWSMVVGMRSEDQSDVRRALVELCQAYWYPVFAYVRRCGHPPEDAYELTRTFLNRLLAELRRSDPREYGQFRGFLLSRLARFLVEERHGEPPSDTAEVPPPPEPLAELDRRQRDEHADETSPERAFQKSFALEILAHALARLRREAQTSGRLAMFEQLEPYLTGEPEPGQYELLARNLATRPLALVVAIKRLRQRFRELVDDELSQTVATSADLDTERSALLAIVGETR